MTSQQTELMAVDDILEETLPPEVDLPDLELTPALLNELFVAEVALQRAQYDVAVEYYARLSVETRDPRLVERATRIALFAREYQTALELSMLWTELDPNNVDAGQILTTLQIKTGDYEAALDSFEHVVAAQASSDNEASRYILMIRLLGREQDKGAALEVIQRYLQRHPDDNAALYTYAQLALRADKLEVAEQAVDQLLQQKPDWTQAVILRTRILKADKRESAAVEYLGKIVSRNSKNIELRAYYGRLLVDMGRFEEALEQFRWVIKVSPEKNDILFAAGLVALRTEQIEEAEKYFLTLNERVVRVDETSYYLGRIEEVRENYDRAIYWYGTVSRGENYINAQVRSALLQARQGDVLTARAHLQAVQARSPKQQVHLYMAEAEILSDVGYFEEALAVYDHALDEMPENAELLYARAMVAEKLGLIDVLEQDLLAILEREPDHVDSLNSLGYTLADQTDRLDEAYAYIERAMELKPNSPYIMDSMGWVLYRQGKLDEALVYLRKAIEGSHASEIAAHLGEVLWVKGDYDGARDIWKKALKVSPESSAVLNAIKRLEK